MRISILYRIVFGILFSIFITGITVFFTSRYFTVNGFEETGQKNLRVMKNIVSAEIETLKTRYLTAGLLLSESMKLLEAIKKGDLKTLKAIAVDAQKRSGAQFVTIADGKGTVIVRSHSEKRQDSITRQQVVQRAMHGLNTVNIERGTAVKLSIRTAAPIFSDGAVIGIIVLGEALDSNRFVDHIKQSMNLEMTIFEGDNRISTTLFNNGVRAVGTKLNKESIVSAVLKGGQDYENNVTLFNKDYKTLYWPLKNDAGQTLGMWFIGMDRTDLEKAISSVTYSCILAVVVVVIVLGILAVLFSHSLVRPLNQCVRFAINVTKGSLDEQLFVKQKDEIGDLADSLRTMLASLKHKINEAEESTRVAEEKTHQAEEASNRAEEAASQAQMAKREGMNAAAKQLEDMVLRISAVANQLSAQIEQSDRSAEESSQRLSEAAAAMNQMNSTVQDVAQNAANAASVSVQTRQNAENGQKILSNALLSINQVQKVSNDLKNDMSTLYEHTQNISQIMNVISDIADQTNLLALNAAIEAARAGEAGRGFAVVADEVRKLAEKTMSSTNDVSHAITAIQSSANQSVNRMQDALKEVDQTTTLATQSGEALQHIVKNVEETADQVRLIATASEEQSAASVEINRSISTVNEMSSQTTQAMGAAAKAITELAQQTELLRQLIEEMKQS